MSVQPKHKVGRNEPCPCGSGLKFKICHGDPVKQMICNRVANERMLVLIRAEQRKQIVAGQQKECEICNGTGYIKGYKGHREKCPSCQFVTDQERIAYEYKLEKEKEDEETKES